MLITLDKSVQLQSSIDSMTLRENRLYDRQLISLKEGSSIFSTITYYYDFSIFCLQFQNVCYQIVLMSLEFKIISSNNF